MKQRDPYGIAISLGLAGLLVFLLTLLHGCGANPTIEESLVTAEARLTAAYTTVAREKRSGLITAAERDKAVHELDKVRDVLNKAHELLDIGDQAGASSNVAIAEGILRHYIAQETVGGDP